jgi:hypothetical protein
VHLWMGNTKHVADAEVVNPSVEAVGQVSTNSPRNAFVRITKYCSGVWDNFPPLVYCAKVTTLGDLKENNLVLWPIADMSLDRTVRFGSLSVLKDGEDSEATESSHEDEETAVERATRKDDWEIPNPNVATTMTTTVTPAAEYTEWATPPNSAAVGTVPNSGLHSSLPEATKVDVASAPSPKSLEAASGPISPPREAVVASSGEQAGPLLLSLRRLICFVIF